MPVADVKAPGGTVVKTTGTGSTNVTTTGANVQVIKTGSGQPTTKVQTVAGVNVVNSPQETKVTGIPFVGSGESCTGLRH